METTQIIRSIPFELSLFFAPCTKSFRKEVVLNIPELSYATYRSGGRRHGGRHCLVPFSRRPCHLFVAFQLWVSDIPEGLCVAMPSGSRWKGFWWGWPKPCYNNSTSTYWFASACRFSEWGRSRRIANR